MRAALLPLGLSFLALTACTANAPVEEAASPLERDTKPLLRATVLVENDKGHATGFLVDDDHILTANHPLNDDDASISFYDGETEKGRVVWRHQAHDIALVEVAIPDGYDAPPLHCAPLIPNLYYETVSHPIDETWELNGSYFRDGVPVGDGYYRIGHSLALGAAGGPVFDSIGNTVGIVQAILAKRLDASISGSDAYSDHGQGLMRPASAFCDDVRSALAALE